MGTPGVEANHAGRSTAAARAAVLRLLRGCDLVIVEQAGQNLLNYVLFVQQFAGRRRVALWGHGRSFGADPHRLGEASKKWWSRRAHWWFAYNDLAADIVSDFGMDPARITVVRNAIDTRALRSAVGAMTEDGAASTRDGLGLTGSHTALYLGRLASEKRLDYLCEAVDAARATVADLEFVIAGGGWRKIGCVPSPPRDRGCTSSAQFTVRTRPHSCGSPTSC